jgi:uncharacterized protein YicC (UPF0701 family)
VSVIFSMTGFASVQGFFRGQTGFTLTLKSVNHRFLDLNLRLPSQCDALEVQMRRVLKERLKRGHVEVTLQIDRKAGGQMQLNSDLLETYVQAYRMATSAKPASAWKTCAPSAVTVSGCIPGSVHSAPSTTAAMASQRHMRNRASAKAAALTTAM